jgi:capsular polysaccharide biosynthesis protein
MYINRLKKHKLLISIGTLCCTFIIGVINYFFIDLQYECEVPIIICEENYNDLRGANNADNSYTYEKKIKTYMAIAKTNSVLKDIREQLDLKENEEQLLPKLDVHRKAKTEILIMKAKSKSPEQAALIANQFAASFKNVCNRFSDINNIKILERAEIPKQAYTPKPIYDMIICFSISLIVFSYISIIFDNYINIFIKKISKIFVFSISKQAKHISSRS